MTTKKNLIKKIGEGYIDIMKTGYSVGSKAGFETGIRARKLTEVIANSLNVIGDLCSLGVLIIGLLSMNQAFNENIFLFLILIIGYLNFWIVIISRLSLYISNLKK